MSQKKKKKKPAGHAGEFKLAAVERLLAGESARELAGELGIRRGLLYKWKDRYALDGAAGLLEARVGRPRTQVSPAVTADARSPRGELLGARKRIAELERKVGQQELELDFFAEALRRIESDQQPCARSSRNDRGKAD